VRQTLVTVPYEVAGVPLFGAGVLLAVWAVASVVLLFASARRHGWRSETLSLLPLVLLVGGVIYALPLLFPGGLPIRGYGMMMLLGVLAGLALAIYRARRLGIDQEQIVSLAFWLFLAGIVGARTFYVLQKWPEFERETVGKTVLAVLNVTQGGLVVYGSLIGGAIAYVVFVRRHRLMPLALADLVAPSMVLGLAIGRVGCLLNGCCFGGACELPWAVTFPWGSPPHERQAIERRIDLHGLRLAGAPGEPARIAKVVPGSQAEAAGLRANQILLAIGASPSSQSDAAASTTRPVASVAAAERVLLEIYGAGTRIWVYTDDSPRRHEWTLGPPPRSLPVHPTQVYSAINAGLICLLLLAFAPLRRRDGEVVALLLTVYPITRLLIEQIRTDEPATWTGLTISQNVSVLLLAGAVALWVYVLRQPRGLTYGTSLTAARSAGPA
jgi:phosphatidylglycerol---prolipoprotein diacylglyceryl transferase